MATLKAIADMIVDDYLAWYKRGMKPNGEWMQRAVFWLEGPAGIGKTELLYQIAKRIKKDNDIANCSVVELFVSSAMDPESVAGTPAPVIETLADGSTIHVLKMHYRDEIVRALKMGPGAIMFLDEMGREPRHMRPLMLKLLSSQKMLAGLDVSQTYVITAGNPADDEHMVDSILEDAAIASRLIRLKVEPDYEEWADWMYELGPTHREVANFILEHPNMLLGRDKTNEVNSAFHSPRSWTAAADSLHIHGGGTDEEQANMNNPAAMLVVTGIVGPVAGQALKAFMTKDRPMSVKHILEGRTQVVNGRINSVPPSVMKALSFHLQTKPLNDTQADNLKTFLDAIPADVASALTRNNRALHPTNLVKLSSRKIFQNFIGRVHKTKRAEGTE